MLFEPKPSVANDGFPAVPSVMPDYLLGECIAERQLVLRSANGAESPACVRIGRPIPSGEDWICPYEVELGAQKRTFAVYGVDSVQALAMAFKVIDVELEIGAKQASATLHWLGQRHSSLVDPVDRKRSNCLARWGGAHQFVGCAEHSEAYQSRFRVGYSL